MIQQPALINTVHVCVGTTLRIELVDGCLGCINIAVLLSGEQLYEQALMTGIFTKVWVSPDGRSIMWPNGLSVEAVAIVKNMRPGLDSIR